MDEFLIAISERITKDWGVRKRQEIIEKNRLGERLPTLQELGRTFNALLHHNEIANRTGINGVFTTFSNDKELLNNLNNTLPKKQSKGTPE